MEKQILAEMKKGDLDQLFRLATRLYRCERVQETAPDFLDLVH